jgi:hypothetical protein
VDPVLVPEAGMILSFSVFREKIESGEKCQTIRKYSPVQYKRFLNCWKKRETNGRYNLFWHNPRNGGTRIRDVVPSDEPQCIFFERVNRYINVWPSGGSDYDTLFPNGESANSLAQRDGFKDYKEMTEWFYREHGNALFSGAFMVIRWRP